MKRSPPLLALLLLPTPQDSGPYVPRIQPASEEAAQAAQRFRRPDGLTIELFAAEPRLANPVAFDVADDGTVYVAETFRHHQGVTDIREHMDWLDDDLAARTVEDRRAMLRKFERENYDAGYGRAFDQVRRIVDRDGDLVADADTVFASGFDDHAAGIGAGVLAFGGDVYYTCIPDLWKLTDADGDGVAERRTALSSGYGVHVALLGHDLHGAIVGPDRRLYFSCGDRGFHVETEDGVIAHPQCGAVLRCELDGSDLEVWHTGLRNPQELAFDDLGDLWTGDNNSDGGDRARWVHVVEGGDSGWRYPYQWITEPVARGPWNDEKLWHPAHAGQAAYLVPPVANLADGPSGLACYPGTGLGERWAGHFFLCDFRGDASASGIHAFTVEPRGASFALGPVERFVWGTLVTDCDFGPDGALWFSDWVYGWEQTGKGRLYRAVDPEAGQSDVVRETRRLLAEGMGGRDARELERLLGHADRRVRQAAHFELAERGQAETLLSVAKGGPTLLARLHALWGLGIAGRTRPALRASDVRTLFADPEPEVRAQTLRVLWDALRAAPSDLSACVPGVVRLLSDPEPRVRFFAALAAARLGTIEAVGPLVKLLAETGEADRDLRHAAVLALGRCAQIDQLDRLATAESRDVRMGVLLVMRGAHDRRIARFLADADPLLVLEAARAIHDLAIEGALDELAALALGPALVGDAGGQPGGLGELEGALVRRVTNAAYRLGRAERLAAHATNPALSEAARSEVLDMLAQWAEPSPRDRVTNEWRPISGTPRATDALPALVAGLGDALAPAADPLAAAWVRCAGAVGASAAAPRLATLVTEPRRGAEVKSAALVALEALHAAELVPAVRAALGDADGRVRAAALEQLARIAPDEALASAAEVAASGDVAERRAAYRILAGHPEPAAVAALGAELARLGQELVPAELALDLVAAAERQGAPVLRDAVAARVAARAAADPVLAPWLDALFGGDPARGDRVFQRVDLTCTRCHAWWPGAAERVGPNLSGVGTRLSRLQILESIVTPNRRTTPGYGATAFFLTDGKVVSGRVYEETPDLVRLFDANNDPIALERSLIDEARADLSAMPEDLAKPLSPADMRDLIAYLAGL